MTTSNPIYANVLERTCSKLHEIYDDLYNQPDVVLADTYDLNWCMGEIETILPARVRFNLQILNGIVHRINDAIAGDREVDAALIKLARQGCLMIFLNLPKYRAA